MMDASVPLECLVGKKLVGHLLPSFGWLTREVHWSEVGQPLPWLDPVNRESGEGHNSGISECRSQAFF